MNRLLARLADRPACVLALLAAAFWPVWRWYLARLDDGSDEPWAVAALAAAALVSWPSRGLRLRAADPLLSVGAGCTLLYAVTTPFLPPLLRALIAMTALACVWTSLSDSHSRFPAVFVLLMLSLPVIASLQFYAGYPLRIVTTVGATEMLQLAGLEVTRAGTNMEAGGRTVLVDAPCSGVRMWWTACLLSCVLAGQRTRLSWAGLASTLLLAMPVVLLANAARAAVLFVLETTASPPAAFVHPLVGIATFVFVGVALLASERLQQRQRRADRGPRLAAAA